MTGNTTSPSTMSDETFPLQDYLGALNRFLDTIDYNDTNYTRSERIKHNKYVYMKTAQHFAQPGVQEALNVSVKVLEATIRTIVLMVINGWAKVSLECQAAVSIHYTYAAVLDDCSVDDPHQTMDSFYADMLGGRPQRHPWWRLVLEQYPNVLRHYGSFCALNLMRSTTDCCWVEQHNFPGYPGSHPYPLFLRRLNGLGQSVGATLFPAAQFDERALFEPITSATAHIEPITIFVNDLCSFYKEWDEPRDQTNLVKNWCRVESMSMSEALARLAQESVVSVERLLGVFENREGAVWETVRAFAVGYITWHFCDQRYRLDEVYEMAKSAGDEGEKFSLYFEKARRAGFVPFEEWGVPRLAEIMQEVRREAEGEGEVEVGIEALLSPKAESWVESTA